MNIYVITYDLRTPGQDYQRLYQEIKKSDCCHAMDSVWLIFTAEDADQINQRLRRKIDQNDFLFVCRLSADRNGWMRRDVWNWINQRVPQTSRV